jgi:hypothetical protein
MHSSPFLFYYSEQAPLVRERGGNWRRDAVLDQMDILSVALGVLINVAENGREWRRHLADVVLAGDVLEEQAAADLLSLLCRIVKVTRLSS